MIREDKRDEGWMRDNNNSSHLYSLSAIAITIDSNDMDSLNIAEFKACRLYNEYLRAVERMAQPPKRDEYLDQMQEYDRNQSRISTDRPAYPPTPMYPQPQCRSGSDQRQPRKRNRRRRRARASKRSRDHRFLFEHWRRCGDEHGRRRHRRGVQRVEIFFFPADS